MGKTIMPTITAIALVLCMFPNSTLAQAAYQPKLPLMISEIVRYGKASWYSEKDPGINPQTANNEIFSEGAMTCAMWDVPFNQQIRITNLANGKTIIVRVNDRGPHKRFVRQGRIVDLTKNAFSQIASLEDGLIEIRLEFL